MRGSEEYRRNEKSSAKGIDTHHLVILDSLLQA